MEEKFTFRMDCEGPISFRNAKTLRRYKELQEEKSKAPMLEFGIFFAYDKKQYAEGYDQLVKAGKIKEGDEVVPGGAGAYGTEEAFDRLIEFYEGIDKMISAECDPQEVYCYEFNNHECFYSWDGDEQAALLVLDYFGAEALRSIKRFYVYYDNDFIINREFSRRKH